MKKTIVLLAVVCILLCIILPSCDKRATVNFDTQGGSEISSTRVIQGEAIAKPTDPQKIGYTLEGWYLDGEKWSFESDLVTEDITLVANWIMDTYTIKYEGVDSHSNKTTYTVEDELVLEAGEKENYIFLGWYEDEECTKPITKIEKGTTGNLKLYAKTSYFPFTVELKDEGYVITGCEGRVWNVTIPDTYNGKPIVAIGDYAFSSTFEKESQLETIVIPDSVTSIGEYVFENCTRLERVTLSKGITKIEKGLFSGCTSLVEIEIPNSVQSIGLWAFEECTSLTRVEIPNSVTEIGSGIFLRCENLEEVKLSDNIESINSESFFNCVSLKSITIPKGVKKIGHFAFQSCTKIEHLEIPSSVTTIESMAFKNCTRLKSVNIPNGVTIIDSETFSNCRSLENITIPNSVEVIGGRAFADCNSLKAIVIPTGVTVIGESAFEHCNNLIKVEISNTVTTIYSFVFNDCNSLKEIVIPSSVTEINVEAFLGAKLTSIIVDGDNQNYSSIGGNLYSKDGKILLRYAPGKDSTSFTTPNGVTTIGYKAFVGCHSLQYVELGNDVTRIEEGAFRGCSGLKGVKLGDGLIRIDEDAFHSCTNLEKIVIPISVEIIGFYSFFGNYNLTIYCEAENKPSSWVDQWNGSNRPVVWSYTGE